jgi:hypothetical protein
MSRMRQLSLNSGWRELAAYGNILFNDRGAAMKDKDSTSGWETDILSWSPQRLQPFDPPQ